MDNSLTFDWDSEENMAALQQRVEGLTKACVKLTSWTRNPVNHKAHCFSSVTKSSCLYTNVYHYSMYHTLCILSEVTKCFFFWSYLSSIYMQYKSNISRFGVVLTLHDGARTV